MDQKKMGSFIAVCRKEKGLTQEQLGEQLHVTNKSVSKWENGRCLPDPSLYQPLCEILEINMIELFDGERIKENNTIEKADHVITDLMQDSKSKTIYKIISLCFTSLCIIIGISCIFVSSLSNMNQEYAIIFISIGLFLLFIGIAIRIYIWAKSKDKVIRNEGMGFCSALTLVFIILKLTGHIQWSWIWVLSPIWISVSLVIILILIFLLVCYIKDCL